MKTNTFKQDLKLQRLRFDVDSETAHRQLTEHNHNLILKAHKYNNIKTNITIAIALISVVLHGVL